MTGLVRLHGATLRDADFREASFGHFSARGCLFERCDFRGTTLDERFRTFFAGAPQNVFRACRFEEADMRAIGPGQARFEVCAFDGARIDGWVSACAEFVDCRFSGEIVDVRFCGRPWGPEADRLDPPRERNAFRGNDLSRVRLTRVTFVMGIDVAAQRWPRSKEYLRLDRFQQRLTRAHAQIMQWEELDARRDGLMTLQEISLLYSQQSEVIVGPGDPAGAARPAVRERVWEVLRGALASGRRR